MKYTASQIRKAFAARGVHSDLIEAAIGDMEGETTLLKQDAETAKKEFMDELDRHQERQEWTPPKGAKVLRLTLSKKPFDVMVTGEKQEEYRQDSEWIRSRLVGKDYDFVMFANGYGKDKPHFVAECRGFRKVISNEVKRYSNGLEVDLGKVFWEILLGPVVASWNLK